jgi:hypothetical protein
MTQLHKRFTNDQVKVLLGGYLSWPRIPIRSGISRSAPITLLGSASDRESVTGSTHLRTVALGQKRQKGLSERNSQLLLSIGLPF